MASSTKESGVKLDTAEPRAWSTTTRRANHDLAESDPCTRVPRLGLLRLRPDPVHGSPSQGPLTDKSHPLDTRIVVRRRPSRVKRGPAFAPPLRPASAFAPLKARLRRGLFRRVSCRTPSIGTFAGQRSFSENNLMRDARALSRSAGNSTGIRLATGFGLDGQENFSHE